MTPDVLDPYAPQVGDHFWVKTHYRRIVEVVERLTDDTWKVDAHDPREDRVVRTKLTIARPARAVGAPKAARTHVEKPRMTPELRQKVETGLACRARGHDLTAPMPDGKPALYISPNGKQRACRWCKQEAAERHKNKKSS